MGRVREVVCGVIGVALLGSMSIAHADWRVFSDAAGAASIRSLDTTLSVGLVLDCTRDVTLVTQDAFPPGNSGYLTLVDPNGRSHTFELAGFGALWRATCSSTG